MNDALLHFHRDIVTGEHILFRLVKHKYGFHKSSGAERVFDGDRLRAEIGDLIMSELFGSPPNLPDREPTDVAERVRFFAKTLMVKVKATSDEDVAFTPTRREEGGYRGDASLGGDVKVRIPAAPDVLFTALQEAFSRSR